MLSLHGVIEANLEGAKLVASVKTSKLVLNLVHVRRFASWGMAEWMNFLRAAQDLDLYFVECSAYAIQQLSQVTGLLGHGKLVSYYASFRCSACSEEQQALIVVAQAPDKLRALTESERPCPTCGGTARMPKHQADIAHDVASKAGYDIDDDVATFLRAQLAYEIPPNLAKFRALRRKQGPRTYLRLSGNLATLAPAKLARAAEGTTVVDLSRVLFAPAQLGPWREFLRAAAGTAETVQLLDCPPGFFEQAVTADDLADPKLKIRSFAQPYTCPRCSTPSAVMIDVAQQLEELVAGALPAHRCPSCKFDIPGPPTAGPLTKLPARERDPELDRFVDRLRQEPDGALENALTLRAPGAKASAVTARSVYLGSLLAALLVGAIVLGVLFVWKDDERARAAPQADKPAATFQRPDWILSDTPSSAYCQEMIGRLMCVGVSGYSTDREAALGVANDAALDELVNVIGLKIEDAWFRDNVLASYGTARTRTLAAMQNAGPRADDPKVRAVRHKVAELLLATGGPAVPAQRADWYWEEYERGSAAGTEFLVFVRYDVSVDALQLLRKRFTDPAPVRDSAVLTAFPGLAWQDAEFAGGAQLRSVGGALAAAGAAPLGIVTAIGDTPVTDAPTFAARLEEALAAGEVAVTVRAQGASAPVVVKP